MTNIIYDKEIIHIGKNRDNDDHIVIYADNLREKNPFVT